MKNYTVQPGDTLFGIAAREYGDGELYPVIARMNQLANPDLILVGQELLVPYVTYRHLWTTDDTTAARAQITQHYYGTQDTKIQLIWEVASGVAQHADRARRLAAHPGSGRCRPPHRRRRRELRVAGRPIGTATTISRS